MSPDKHSINDNTLDEFSFFIFLFSFLFFFLFFFFSFSERSIFLLLFPSFFFFFFFFFFLGTLLSIWNQPLCSLPTYKDVPRLAKRMRILKDGFVVLSCDSEDIPKSEVRIEKEKKEIEKEKERKREREKGRVKRGDKLNFFY